MGLDQSGPVETGLVRSGLGRNPSGPVWTGLDQYILVWSSLFLSFPVDTGWDPSDPVVFPICLTYFSQD